MYFNLLIIKSYSELKGLKVSITQIICIYKLKKKKKNLTRDLMSLSRIGRSTMLLKSSVHDTFVSNT